MSSLTQPCEANAYLVDHIRLMRHSLHHYAGQHFPLTHWPDESGDQADIALAKAIFDAPFIVVSHNIAADPVFNYGNRAALNLFEMTWTDFTTLPSRQSAEPPNREERSRLLHGVTTQGYISGYSGVRISKTGRRFRIEEVTVWNLLDAEHNYAGQAAMYNHWTYL